MSRLGDQQLGVATLAGHPGSRVHRLDPRAKVIGLVGVTLVAVSAPLRAWPTYVGCAAVLVAVAVIARVRPHTVWRRARVVLPLVIFVAVFVPFVQEGGAAHDLGPLSVSEAGLATFAEVSAKAALGTVSAVLLAATTTFPHTLRALEALRVPAVLVLIAGFMYRYLFVVADEVGRVRAALAARVYAPRCALQAGALGRAAGSLFVRTYSRGERIHVAMLARGFDGRMPHLDPLAFRRADAAFVAGVLAALLGLRILAEGL